MSPHRFDVLGVQVACARTWGDLDFAHVYGWLPIVLVDELSCLISRSGCVFVEIWIQLVGLTQQRLCSPLTEAPTCRCRVPRYWSWRADGSSPRKGGSTIQEPYGVGERVFGVTLGEDPRLSMCAASLSLCVT